MISQEHKRQQKKNQYDLKADRTSHGSAERHNKDDAQKATTQILNIVQFSQDQQRANTAYDCFKNKQNFRLE